MSESFGATRPEELERLESERRRAISIIPQFAESREETKYFILQLGLDKPAQARYEISLNTTPKGVG